MTTHPDHYTYRVQWSAEDQEYVGTVAEFPSLSWLAGETDQALHGIRTAVADVLDEMAAEGEHPPVAIAD